MSRLVYDVLGEENVVDNAMAVILLGRALVDTPVAIDDKLRAIVSQLQGRRAVCSRARLQARVAQRAAYLVLCLGLGKLNSLLEDAALLLQLDRLLPVVKGASHVNVLGVVFPAKRDRQHNAQLDSGRAGAAPCECVFAHGGVEIGVRLGCEGARWVRLVLIASSEETRVVGGGRSRGANALKWLCVCG